jgi:DNA topoisomerase I
MAKLIIVESPGKVKTISSFLGKDYIVMASVGHIRLLDKTGKHNLGVNIEGDFEPSYINDPEKKEIIKKLKEAAKSADAVYLASDNDLEGESISWHLKEILKVPKEKLFRITFNEITKKAVEEALKHPRQINDNKVNAQETRRIIDRIVGFRLSNVTLSKLNAKSAGRVQSSALKIIVDRELEIKAFIPKEYFELYLPFDKNKKVLKAQYKGTDKKKIVSVKSLEDINKIISECKTGNYEVGAINSKERIIPSKPPYTTSTFQQEMSAKLNMSSKRAMYVAQKLYEGMNVDGKHYGLISYMRTDSTRLSDEFIAEAKTVIEKNHGKEYYTGKVNEGKSKGAENVQDAHEGIRPSHLEFTPEKMKAFLESDEIRVYTLIYNRALAALMTSAKIKDTEVMIHNGNHRFGITGHEIAFDGYMKLYQEFKEDSEDDDKILPSFKVGEKINDKPLEHVRKETSPPSRYTEASIVKKLEELGIGRPSTYAAVMETLKDRDYVSLDKKMIVPSERGIKVSQMMGQYFDSFINTTYTAEMEKRLDEIAEGKVEKLNELKEFYKLFAPLVIKANKEMNKDKPKPVETENICPKCGAKMVIRKGKFGDFLACGRYPHCKHTEKILVEGAQPAVPTGPAPVVTEHTCPACKQGKLVERVAKTGKAAGSKFYACNKFPKCKTTFNEKDFTEKFINSEGFSDISTDTDL